jgi:hypothetical protein
VWRFKFHGGLCCVGFINPFGVVAGVRRQRLALSIGPNLNRLQMKTETESSLRNVEFQIKYRTTDNVQNCDRYMYVILAKFLSVAHYLKF